MQTAPKGRQVGLQVSRSDNRQEGIKQYRAAFRNDHGVRHDEGFFRMALRTLHHAGKGRRCTGFREG
jgi:hypothetical protein